ncbi:MAG TPA: LLM class flavin-dependent oxidoreductase [Candidatus Limnocylindrales bacterium]
MDVFLTGAFGLETALTHAIAAEQHGLGGVWFAEHHFVEYGRIPSATLFAAAVLQATSRITVGTAACVFSARNPVALAEEVAMLHTLYGKRFQVGVARGGPWIENDVLGGGMERYREGFPDWLASLLAHLRGRGEVRIVPGVESAVNVRVAATSMATVETAARLGLPLQLGVEKSDDEVKAMVGRWEEICGVPGADHARVVLPTGVERADLAAWLNRRAAKDWSAHIDRLLSIHPVDDAVVPRRLCMVEAAGSPEAADALIRSARQSGG